MRNNFLKNYKFMLKTISKASASRVWLDIFFTVINDLFSILYHVIFFSYFMEMVEKGKIDYLVIGGRAVGENRFAITSMSEAWDVVYSGGELAKASVSVTLEEYT